MKQRLIISARTREGWIIDDMRPTGQDEKTIAERKWRAPLRASANQLPADVGLFSDDADQLDLCEMFMEPTNE